MNTLCQFEPGEVIIKENDMGETAYIIERGQVEVTKDLDGKSVHLGYIGAEETFGEMSMIDDKPRSATVTAVVETVAREINRDKFFESLQTDPEVSISILKVLFERLRESHVKILQLQQTMPDAFKQISNAAHDTPGISGPAISMEGLTPIASQSLPENPYVIKDFPFLVGRKSRDPLSYNHLNIEDSVPLQISRHHMEFIKDGDRIGISDRGSYLGSIVDGKLLGGDEGTTGPLFFEESEGTLILGNNNSSFRYKIKVA